MVLPIVEEIRALPTSLPPSAEAESEGSGRWRFNSRSSDCELADRYIDTQEKDLCSVIEISKLKGQAFDTCPNAKLMAANQRSMIYAMKEGCLRVINQSGVDHFKLAKSSKARVHDIALTREPSDAKDSPEDLANVLLCLDESGTVAIFFLEACKTQSHRLQQIELVLSDLEPQRVIMHPKDSTCFVTSHLDALRVWNVSRLRAQARKEATSQIVHTNPQDAFCGDVAFLPKVAAQLPNSQKRIRDLSFTVDGSCVAAITEDCLFVWQLYSGRGAAQGQGLKLIQQLTIEKSSPEGPWPEGPTSIRFLADRERSADVEAMVLAAASGCSLSVYAFTRGSPQPVCALLQHIRLASPGSDARAVPEVDSIRHTTLALTFSNRNCFAVLPLACNLTSSSRMAFPYVQRFGLDLPADHLALMTAMSHKNVYTLFIYRIVLRRQEEMPAVQAKHEVMVHQPKTMKLLAAEEAPELTSPSSSDSGPPQQDQEVEPSPAVEVAWANGIQSGADVSTEERGGDVGDGSGDGLPTDSAAGPARKPEEVDMFVKRIAASFVLGLSKKKEHLADRITQEVVSLLKYNGIAGQSDPAMLDQVLAKVREARQVQAASDKKLQETVNEATDAWAETSAASMSSLLAKEFAKLSQGMASNLAQQLSQSRKFCETLAKGVQKSSTAATKQALESLRPPKQLQEAVGAALGEALQESLAPVFKAEIQSHFENELGPLIGQRVSEMLTAFRDSMTDCLESIAAEHEQAAERLGRDLAPIIADELKQVRQLVQSSSSGSNSIQEAQLDELMRVVETEVIQPLHVRVKELTAQVQALRVEATELQRRSTENQGSQDLGPEAEAAQAKELQSMFRHGRVEDAFMRAIQKQRQARHQDYLECLCSLVQEPEAWLTEDSSGSPISAQVKMQLMHALAVQLSEKVLDEPIFLRKVDWIQELWLALDLEDEAVDSQAKGLCAQLIEALDSAQADGPSKGQAVRKLMRTLQQAAKMLARD